jgi:hypothetical protein
MVLRLRTEAPDWRPAKCLGEGTGPDMDPWFDNTEYGFENQTELGLEVCNGTVDGVVCPIRHECLLFALVNNERFGVWGGTSEIDRRAIRKLHPWPGGSEPHPEWEWHPPGEVAQLLKQRGVETIEEDEEDDDDD